MLGAGNMGAGCTIFSYFPHCGIGRLAIGAQHYDSVSHLVQRCPNALRVVRSGDEARYASSSAHVFHNSVELSDPQLQTRVKEISSPAIVRITNVVLADTCLRNR